MSHSGPSAVEITLSEDERAELVRRAEAPDRRAAERARIILACADGMSNAGAARAAEVAVGTVAKWRRKFAGRGAGRTAGRGPYRPAEGGPGLERSRTGSAAALGEAGEDRAVSCLAGQDRAALRAGRDEQAGRGGTRC